MDGAQIDGTQIKVNEAWERHQKPRFNGASGPNKNQMAEIREALYDAQRAVKRAMTLVSKYGGGKKPRGGNYRQNRHHDY